MHGVKVKSCTLSLTSAPGGVVINATPQLLYPRERNNKEYFQQTNIYRHSLAEEMHTEFWSEGVLVDKGKGTGHPKTGHEGPDGK